LLIRFVAALVASRVFGTVAVSSSNVQTLVARSPMSWLNTA
jgi:hypothetical protein